MIPRLMHDILKWPTCCMSSVRIHTQANIPTICLLATRLYFLCLLMAKVDISRLLGSSSSSSSEEMSSSLTLDGWHLKQKSLLFFLSNSMGQLQAFNLRPFSTRKILLILFKEGLGKKSEPLRDAVGFHPRYDMLVGLFRDWSIRDSHFAAGSLSSITSTFPAFSGTISWKLMVPEEK